MNNEQSQQQLTFGQKAAGVTFNPGGHPEVDNVKAKVAELIDVLHELRSGADVAAEAKRYYSKAISHLEDGQMNAVKAITWQW